MDAWAQRTHIPLTTAEALGATYARAHRWFQALKQQLIREHDWSESSASDPRLLFAIETSSIWRSSVGLPAGPKLKLCLPVHASSFFSPERRVQWEMVFHSDIFDSVRKICPPINDILYLMQCLWSVCPDLSIRHVYLHLCCLSSDNIEIEVEYLLFFVPVCGATVLGSVTCMAPREGAAESGFGQAQEVLKIRQIPSRPPSNHDARK